MSKKTLKNLIIGVLATFAVTAGISYSYFAINVSGSLSNVTFTTNLQTQPTITFSAESADVSMTIQPEDMLESQGSNDYSKYKSGTATLAATINNGSGGGSTTCTYSIKYDPITSYTASAAATANNLLEYTITGSLVNSNTTNGSYSINSVAQTSLAGVTSAITLVNAATLKVAGANNSSTFTWTFTFKYYNLAVDQSDKAGATPKGTVQFQNVSCVPSST